MSSVTWRVSLIEPARKDLDAAHATNDVHRWQEARRIYDAAIAEAHRALDRTTGRLAEATTETKAALDTAIAAIDANDRHAHELEPPLGYAPVVGEAELLACFRAAPTDPTDPARRAILAALSIADLRILRDRIANPAARDELAGAIWKLGPAGRQEVSALIHKLDRDKARARAAAVRAANAPPPLPAPPASLDTRLLRALDAPERERAFAAEIETADFAVRRDLARRLRAYRPGNGDALAARLTTLAPDERTHLLALLDHESPRDAVHVRATSIDAPASMLDVRTPAGPAIEPAPGERCVPASAATIGAEIESSLGPAERPAPAPAPGTPLDRFTAGVARVAPTYAFPSAPAAAPPSYAAAAKYLEINAIAAWDDLRSYLADVTWPDLPPSLAWRAEARFSAELVQSLRRRLPGFAREVVADLLYPHDLFATIDALRPDGGRLAWVPAVGLALGQVVQRVGVASLGRTAARIAAAADETGAFDRAAIPTTHPMDGFVLAALHAPGVIDVQGHAHAVPPASARAIRLTWQGGRESSAWNWVRAEPADATVEEVVAQLAREPGGEARWFAAAVAVAPPLFGIPAAWARSVPAAAAHMPRALAPAAFDLRIDTPEARLVELARHDVAHDPAVHESDPAAPMPVAKALDVLDDCAIQLAAIERDLAAWKMTGFAAEARARIERTRRDVILAPAAEAATSRAGAIALGQRGRLAAIAAALGELADQIAAVPTRDRDAARAALAPVARKLGGAAATSPIAAASDALFADALRTRAELGVDAVQAQILDVAAATGGPTAAARGPAPARSEPSARRHAREAEADIAAARQVQDELLNGRAVAPAAIEDATLATRETALRSRLDALFVQAGQLEVAAEEAGAGASGEIAALFNARFRTLPDVTGALRRHVDRVNSAWWEALHARGTSVSPAAPDLAARRAAYDVADQAFAAIHDDTALMQLLADGQALIRAQQLRRVFLDLAALIVIAFTVKAGAGAIAESIGAALVSFEGAEGVAELSATARAIAGAADLAIQVGGNAVGQVAVSGTGLGDAVIDNLVFAIGGHVIAGAASAEVGAARAAARAIEREAGAAIGIERRLLTLGSAGLEAIGWVAGKAVEITGESVTNAALASLAATLEGHPHATPDQARDWFVQALSVAVGRSVHAAIGDRLPGLERLARRMDATAAERRVLADARELAEVARALAHARVGRAEDALGVLAERTRLLERELALVAWRARWLEDPHAAHELEARRDELHGQADAARGDALVAVRMHLIGLDELVPGRVWKGTAADLHRAASELGAAHTVTQASGAGRDVALLVVDGRTYEVHLRPEPVDRHREAPHASHELSTELESVPGSTLRGTSPGAAAATAEDQAALLRAANEAMPRIAEAADVAGIEPLGASRFAVTLRDGALTVIDISVVRIEDHDVARLIPNSSRDQRIGDRAAHGEHVIQLSAHLPVAEVERALAHAVARLTVVHQRAQTGSFGDGARREDGGLAGPAADTVGRLAELRVLVARLAAHPDDAAAIRREILALADHLGAVGADPASRTRRSALEGELSPVERAELERAGRGGDALDPVREAARRDLAADLARGHQRGNDRLAPYDLVAGERMSRDELARFAAAAQRLRALESQHTLARLRADAGKLAVGHYVRVEDVQIGGGAALTARTPRTLLIDQRGRWQADGSQDIAQTAQQLGELYKARFGDVRQVAGPKERVPLEAIRFWEDSLAAMGPVIDGAAAPRWDGEKLLLDITPSDGTEGLTIEIGGTPTIATGFVPEAVPGRARMNMVDVMTTLEGQLDQIIEKGIENPVILDAAQAALLRLRAISKPRATDGRVSEALEGPHRQELEAALRARDTVGRPLATDTPDRQPAPAVRTKEALAVAEAGDKWGKLIAEDAKDGIQQVAFGDEANLETRVSELLRQLDAKLAPSAEHPLRIVMAGAGGTAVSAAGIILARPHTAVTMLGRGTPAGLRDNPQFTELAAKHADAELADQLGISPGDGRLKMYLDPKLSFEIPRVMSSEGGQTFQVHPGREGREDEFVGDAYVVSAGRVAQTPPIVSDLILQTTRANGSVSYRADFDADKQYVGYTVFLELGGKRREITITGAASRYMPTDALKFQPGGEQMVERIHRASGGPAHDSADVPAVTGGFPGGAAGSAVQGQRHAARDNRKVGESTDKEQP